MRRYDLRLQICKQSEIYKLEVSMPTCNPPSLKPLWQTLQTGHDCKLFLGQGETQLIWLGDLTWSDLGSKSAHIVQNLCVASCTKRGVATRRGFLVMRKKREGGNICPPLGRRLITSNWHFRVCVKFNRSGPGMFEHPLVLRVLSYLATHCKRHSK